MHLSARLSLGARSSISIRICARLRVCIVVCIRIRMGICMSMRGSIMFMLMLIVQSTLSFTTASNSANWGLNPWIWTNPSPQVSRDEAELAGPLAGLFGPAIS